MNRNFFIAEVIQVTREKRVDGTVIRVFVQDGKQAIKFDCLRRGAHYHLDPDGRNRVYPIDDPLPLQWAAYAIRENLRELLQSAGYVEAAAELGAEALRSQVEHVASLLQTE
jgi:hypothetical protein